jgi:hypothetical protein
MRWKADLDSLVEQTMALVKNVPDDAKFEPTSRTVEEEAHEPSGTFEPMIWPKSVREEAWRRVASFKAHQQRLQREREDYCDQTLAKARGLLASKQLNR